MIGTNTVHHLLRQWMYCLPNVRNLLVICAHGPTGAIIKNKYRLESCGSGLVLGYYTKVELQKWLQTHRLFLGHDGTEITNMEQIAEEDVQKPIVAMKNSFRGELVRTSEGYMYWVNCVAWDPQWSTLAGGMDDGAVKLWNKNGNLIQRLEGHTNSVNCVAWSPDGATLASGSWEVIKMWSKDGELINTLEGHMFWVNCVAWSSDGQTLASGASDNTINLWSKDGELIHTLGQHKHPVMCIAWHPSGHALASGSTDGTLKLWNTKDGNEILVQTLKKYEHSVNCVAWNPQGSTLASGSLGVINLWSKDGKLIHTLDTHIDWVTSVVWHPSRYTLAGMSENCIKVWNKEGDRFTTQTLEGSNDVHYAVWSLDGSTLAGTSRTGTIKLWK